MANGLGIDGFLKHNADGNRGKWLKQWNKNQKGDVTFWLHTRAPIVPSFSHQFNLEDEYQDKETGKKEPILRFLRFISPDPEIVHRNQFFREEDGQLQVKPTRDPFLLLREWLRFADHLALDQPIFRWTNPKAREIITWERGPISGLVKRGKADFGHSLDTKLEYVFVVLDNDNINDGPVLARFGKLAAQRITEVISQQREIWGQEEGDPIQHPYAFHLQMRDAKSPMDTYKGWKEEKLELSDEVWEKISSEDYPDPLPHGQPSDGDFEKIRDAMESAAQVELPLDDIFSEDQDVRLALCRPKTSARPAPRPSRAAQQRAAASAPEKGAKPAQVRTPAHRTSAAKPAAAAETSAPETAAPGRRKKVDKPAEPEVQKIACDDCGHMMLPTDAKCAKCGAEYEVEAPEEPKSTVSAKPAAAKPAAARPASKPKPVSRQQELPQEPDAEGDDAEVSDTCWACEKPLEGKRVCPSCGVDQDDDIPF